jgi:hypothetical protein
MTDISRAADGAHPVNHALVVTRATWRTIGLQRRSAAREIKLAVDRVVELKLGAERVRRDWQRGLCSTDELDKCERAVERGWRALREVLARRPGPAKAGKPNGGGGRSIEECLDRRKPVGGGQRLPSIESLQAPAGSQSCACSSSIQVHHPTS